MKPIRLPLTLLLLLPLLLAACAGEAPPPDHFYRLDVPPAPVMLERPAVTGTLEVAPLLADGLVTDRAVVYAFADEPFQVHQYNYQFWNTPPSQLVQDQLIAYLRSARVAERIISPDLRLPVDMAVEGRVRRFDQVFHGDRVTFLVELEFALIRVADETLLLLKTYRAEEVAADDSLPAAALAANAALRAVFTDLLDDLRQRTEGPRS